jgi:hypothetical protein
VVAVGTVIHQQMHAANQSAALGTDQRQHQVDGQAAFHLTSLAGAKAPHRVAPLIDKTLSSRFLEVKCGSLAY